MVIQKTSTKMETLKKVKELLDRISSKDFSFSDENIEYLTRPIINFSRDYEITREKGKLNGVIFDKIDVWYSFDEDEFLFKISGDNPDALEISTQILYLGELNFNKNKGSSLLKDSFGHTLYDNIWSHTLKIVDEVSLTKFVSATAKKFILKELKEIYIKVLENESSLDYLEKVDHVSFRRGIYKTPLCILSPNEQIDTVKKLIFTETNSQKIVPPIRVSKDSFQLLNKNLISYTHHFQELVNDVLDQERKDLVSNLILEINKPKNDYVSELRLDYFSDYLYNIYLNDTFHTVIDTEEKDVFLKDLSNEHKNLFVDTESLFLYLFKKLSSTEPGTGLAFLDLVLRDGKYKIRDFISKEKSFYSKRDIEGLIVPNFSRIVKYILNLIESDIDGLDKILLEYIAYEKNFLSNENFTLAKHYQSSKREFNNVFVSLLEKRYKEESLSVIDTFEFNNKLKYNSSSDMALFSDEEERLLSIFRKNKKVIFLQKISFEYSFAELIKIITYHYPSKNDERFEVLNSIKSNYLDDVSVAIPDEETKDSFKSKLSVFKDNIETGIYDEFKTIPVLNCILDIYLKKL